jgi:hypothetical protein
MQKIYVQPFTAFDIEPDVYYEIPYNKMNSVRPLYELNLRANQVFYTYSRDYSKHIPANKNYKYKSKAYFFIGKDSDEDKIPYYTIEKLEQLTEQCKAMFKPVKYDKGIMLKKREQLQKQLAKVNEDLKNVEQDIKNA